MGPSQHVSNGRSNQDVPTCRKRRCLLKGCGRSFQPNNPFNRYCSPQCLSAARHWSDETSSCRSRLAQQEANRRYRASENGKAHRRLQARRYRQRQREAQSQPPPGQESEGYTPDCQDGDCQKFFCRRPGCYVRFKPPPRSPLKRFCSSACHQALRTVLVRERRWQVRLEKLGRRMGDADKFS